MIARIEPTILRHKIGMCPACRDLLWAEVDVAINVSAPTITVEGRASAVATPEFMGMRLAHHCSRSEDGDWVNLGAGEPA